MFIGYINAMLASAIASLSPVAGDVKGGDADRAMRSINCARNMLIREFPDVDPEATW